MSKSRFFSVVTSLGQFIFRLYVSRRSPLGVSSNIVHAFRFQNWRFSTQASLIQDVAENINKLLPTSASFTIFLLINKREFCFFLLQEIRFKLFQFKRNKRRSEKNFPHFIVKQLPTVAMFMKNCENY